MRWGRRKTSPHQQILVLFALVERNRLPDKITTVSSQLPIEPQILDKAESWTRRNWKRGKRWKVFVYWGGVFLPSVLTILLLVEMSSKKERIHDLELELLPFRNLAVQQFNNADAASLKKLAESMAILHKDYSNQLHTIDNLRDQIDQIRKASEEAERNLFSKAIHEKISSANTNSFFKRRTTEGAWRVIVKLQAAPIPGSFRGAIAGPYAIDDRTIPPSAIKNNLFIQTFWGAWVDFPPDMPFNMEYIADGRETNLVKRVEFVSDDLVLLDGKPLSFK
jgi:hypothetical protein